VAFVEDLTPFFADFGEDGTLAGLPVRVIFDEPADNEIGITGLQPQAVIASSSVPSSAFGATLILDGGEFTVREARPDGRGTTLLLLARVS
jgi:hypothetical protein